MNAASLINQDSGDVEYYTPQLIIEAARLTLGEIDLDPASSPTANVQIKASRFYSANALELPWGGRVWMNHPFGRASNAAWIAKLVESYETHRVPAACCITFAATSELWFKPLLAFPQCFLAPRTNYLLPNGTIKRGVTKGSVVTYFGPDLPAFVKNFKAFGVIKIAI